MTGARAMTAAGVHRLGPAISSVVGSEGTSALRHSGTGALGVWGPPEEAPAAAGGIERDTA
jgi:hypothetical protein